MRIQSTFVSLTRSLRTLGLPLAAAVACAACGPSPELAQTPCSVEPVYVGSRVSGSRDVYVYVDTPNADVRPALPPPAPLPPDNPFAFTRTWVGEYDCPQGLTDMTLRVNTKTVKGDRVNAIFEFHHAPSGAAGRYHVSGRFDPETRIVTFAPGEWIERPPGYITVAMRGRLSNDGVHFDGRILHPRCGKFSLRASSE